MTLTEAVEGFSGRKVLVVGDVGLDRYIHGDCARLCPEAPVPVFTPKSTESRVGLAGNVAANLASLGAQVKLCSIIGDDQDGFEIQDALDRLGVIEVEKYLCKIGRKTTVKNRYVSDWHLLLRIDEEETKPFRPEIMARFTDGVVKEANGWADIIIVQDYAKGLINQDLMSALGHSVYIREKDLVVDPSPKQDPSIYYGATYLKPNHKEAGEMSKRLGLAGIDDLCDRLKLKGLLVSAGSQGMIYYKKGCSSATIPALRHEVHDVCGAGDTVTAVFSLCIVSGLSFEESARIANAAASVVVGKFGTSTLNQKELLEVLGG